MFVRFLSNPICKATLDCNTTWDRYKTIVWPSSRLNLCPDILWRQIIFRHQIWFASLAWLFSTRALVYDFICSYYSIARHFVWILKSFDSYICSLLFLQSYFIIILCSSQLSALRTCPIVFLRLALIVSTNVRLYSQYCYLLMFTLLFFLNFILCHLIVSLLKLSVSYGLSESYAKWNKSSRTWMTR